MDEKAEQFRVMTMKDVYKRQIGEGVVETLKKYPKSPAVLMQNHGPFTIGKDAEAAVKAAAMTEELSLIHILQQLRLVTHMTDELTLRETVKDVCELDCVCGEPSILRVLN